MIYWERMASPQKDEYDTGIILDIISRQAENLSLESTCQGVIVLDNSITTTYIEQKVMNVPQYENAPLNHPNIWASKKYLKSWPEVYNQVKRLLKVLHPFFDTSIQKEYIELAIGSTSFSIGLPFGYICSTVDNALGLAMALVREMAHHKLRCIGIFEDHAERLIKNSKEELLLSPMDKRKNVFVTSVFHELYTSTHILNLCLRLARRHSEEGIEDIIYQHLAKNLIRVEFAYCELSDKIKTDREGEIFIGSFMNWVRNTVNDSKDSLAETEYGCFNNSIHTTKEIDIK